MMMMMGRSRKSRGNSPWPASGAQALTLGHNLRLSTGLQAADIIAFIFQPGQKNWGVGTDRPMRQYLASLRIKFRLWNRALSRKSWSRVCRVKTCEAVIVLLNKSNPRTYNRRSRNVSGMSSTGSTKRSLNLCGKQGQPIITALCLSVEGSCSFHACWPCQQEYCVHRIIFVSSSNYQQSNKSM